MSNYCAIRISIYREWNIYLIETVFSIYLLLRVFFLIPPFFFSVSEKFILVPDTNAVCVCACVTADLEFSF